MKNSNHKRIRVVVAMSGGVDSSVAAALLHHQGYEVIGMMMKLWSAPESAKDNSCCTPDAMALAKLVAAKFGIPLYTIDAQEVFKQIVVEDFIKGHIEGLTPNPCILCNLFIRWELLLKHALATGADCFATGHYARLQKDHRGKMQLLQASDHSKDQSYVLHKLNQEQLSRTLFPLGEFNKSQVRQMAHEYSLLVADQADSQDLCFLGNGDYRDFLKRYAPETLQPGAIKTTSHQLIGDHPGLAFYTIGQRKGIKVRSPYPLYVIQKDHTNNTLFVGGKEELGRHGLEIESINWISEQAPQKPFPAQVKIRYKANLASGMVIPQRGNRVKITFEKPLRDITPGQSAVVYDGEICLGGGKITK